MTASIIMGVYLAANVIGFVVCAADKRAAWAHRRRVSEKALLGIAFIGGAAGVYLAMAALRHKTRKWRFSVLVPLAAVAQAAAVYGLADKI